MVGNTVISKNKDNLPVKSKKEIYTESNRRGWETRRKLYPPNGISPKELAANKKRKYWDNAPPEVLDRARESGRNLGKKNTGPDNNIKAWKTRRERYGPSGGMDNRGPNSVPSNRKGLTWEQFYGLERSQKIKNKLSNSVKELRDDPNSVYNTPEYKEKQLKGVREVAADNLMNWRNSLTPKQEEELQRLAAIARQIQPNKLETRIITVCKEYNLPFTFTGAKPYPGLGGKMPDFVHEEKKQIIEIFGNHWHKPGEEEERKKYLKEFGYTTLVLWESELKIMSDTKLTERIQLFTRGVI